MVFPVVGQRCSARFLSPFRPRHPFPSFQNAARRRLIFNFLRKSKTQDIPKDEVPILTEDNLFHVFSKSPFPAVRGRGEAIQKLAPCPVCVSSHSHVHAHTRALPKLVKFECPDCGWPTHCTEEHWAEDKEHQKYCTRLREANEDEHDLRSGRRLREFELPGAPGHLLKGVNFKLIQDDRTTRLRGSYIFC